MILAFLNFNVLDLYQLNPKLPSRLSVTWVSEGGFEFGPPPKRRLSKVDLSAASTNLAGRYPGSTNPMVGFRVRIQQNFQDFLADVELIRLSDDCRKDLSNKEFSIFLMKQMENRCAPVSGHERSYAGKVVKITQRSKVCT